MKSKIPRIFLILTLACLFAPAYASPRVRFTINDGWNFIGSDVANGEKFGADATASQRVHLPHTWNIADTLDDEPGYRRGIGWYRKQLNIPAEWNGKRIFLYFEGVNQTADVFVNEKPAGSHVGGYSAFAFDVTELVRSGESNLLAVRVDNSLNNDIPPLDADFNMHGGIYRDVWLVATNDLHIRMTDMASSGIVIRTPKVSEQAAEVSVQIAMVNASARPREFELIASVIDPEGRVVGTASRKERMPAGREMNLSIPSLTVRQPKLWSPDSPYLYTLRTVVRENGKDTDRGNEPLGFRWYRFDPDEGFFLNGKPLKLRGANRHQDFKGYGNAVPDDVQIRDLEIIKQNGFNFVRLAHYPQDPSVLAAADRLGLMLWEETPIVNVVHLSEAFNRNSETMLREMIRQHRNHPSVILWGYMNEIFLRAPKNDAQTKATVDLARRLEEVAGEEDPTRPTAIAFDNGARELYHSSGLSRLADVIGWNLYHGWYYGTFDDLGKFMDEEHRRLPDKPLFISEYGANADRRVHSLAPRRFDSTTEWQRMYHESYLRQINERRFISGSAVWNMFDFSSEFRGETIPHINQKGLYTYDRKPKDVAWFYKASFLTSPVLHIAATDWPERSGSREQPIDVYTNLDEVELSINGVSVGTKSGGGSRRITWTAAFRPGSNSITARGTMGGVTVVDEAEVTWIDPADMSNIAVNVGSNAEYVHETGSLWQSDKAFTSGGWGHTGTSSKEAANLRNIFGTEQDAVAQTGREGTFGYRFDTAAGEYEVELWFAELKGAIKPGERVFDVWINGSRVAAGLDPTKEAGAFTLIVRKFRIGATNRSGVSIELHPVAGQPILNGLRLRRIN